MSKNEHKNHNDMVVTGTSEESLRPIPDLNIDCLEELFEWISLADLFVIRRTCKRFKQAVDYYIKTYYPAVGKIEISDKNFAQFQRIESNCIKLIKGIRFSIKGPVIADQMEHLKECFNQVEDIRITNLKFHGDFYEDFLKFCPKLKYLSVQYCDKLKIGTGNKWLTQHYPTLQHIHFDDKIYGAEEISELKTFFKLNPQIRTLSSTIYFLLKHTNLFCGANIHFDYLIVSVSGYFEDEMTCVCNLLNRLHRYGFYKHVNIRGLFYSSDQEEIDLLGSVPALEKLFMFNREAAIPHLPDLKELRFTLSGIPSELEAATSNLKNIERIYFEKAPFDSVLLIVQHFPKVKLMKVDDIVVDGMHFKKNVIDLKAINNERRKLNGACKMTIYVKDTIYLATKYATTNTQLSLIALKRSETHEWEHDYY
ncbi:uncharacterized protein LOC129571917 [Sitodiplosis mosellana]|uniref:uncharacterized protein LOC129571917 n=1 Tax=Sitodiplosis mosellana TaxID=263140 RepID=UPI0024446670|nr:uncharacterized protein LOC129571917 [Sitodiplosis mosellana]